MRIRLQGSICACKQGGFATHYNQCPMFNIRHCFLSMDAVSGEEQPPHTRKLVCGGCLFCRDQSFSVKFITGRISGVILAQVVKVATIDRKKGNRMEIVFLRMICSLRASFSPRISLKCPTRATRKMKGSGLSSEGEISIERRTSYRPSPRSVTFCSNFGDRENSWMLSAVGTGRKVNSSTE